MPNYNHSYNQVNNQGYLTHNNHGYIVGCMKFNERLVAARKHAGLTQQQLVDRLPKKEDEKPIMSQANLAKMEKNPNGNGSMYTALIADICGVSAVWLTTGEGSMLEQHTYARDEKETRVLMAMQQMDEYQKDTAIKILNSLVEPAAGTKGTATTKQ